jgi:hypothetical protein
MAFEVHISGEVYEAESPSISIREQARAIAQTSVSVLVGVGQTVPLAGQRVEFFLGSTKLFRGIISDVDYPEFSGGEETRVYALSVQSAEWVLAARSIAKTYYNKTYSQVVQDIFDTTLVEENLTLGGITTTSTVIKRFTVDGKIYDVLTKIADVIGPAVFWIDADLKFYFRVDTDMSVATVPSDITKIKLKESLADLRTVQTVQGASSRIKSTKQNATAIATLAARSGFSGKIEAKETNGAIYSPTAADGAAQVLLDEYDEVERNLTTTTSDLVASERYKIWPVNLTTLGIVGDFVVVERTMKILSLPDSTVEIQVKLKNRGYFQRYGFSMKTVHLNATDALQAIGDIASDGIFSPVEKASKKTEWLAIVAEKPVLTAKAATYSVSTTAHDAAFQALADYLNGGATWSSGLPLWFQDDELSVSQEIVAEDFTAAWNGYYLECENLGKAITDAAKASATSAQAAAQAYADSLASNLQTQIDGAITTWFASGVPTLANTPASAWTTSTDRDRHLGDLYYDNATGYAYRFRVSSGTYSWLKLTDSDVTAALAAASAAQSTANGKSTTFATLALARASGIAGDLFLDASLLYRATVAGSSITLSNSVRLTPKRYSDVASSTALAALTGMIANDTVFQTDAAQWWVYSLGSWVVDGPNQIVPVTPSDTNLAFRLPLEDLPLLPDNAAGTLWAPDMTATPSVSLVRMTMTVANGYWRFSATTTDPYIEFSLPRSCHGRLIILKMRRVSGAFAAADTAFGYVFSSGYAHLQTIESFAPGQLAKFNAAPIGTWVYLSFVVPTTYTDLLGLRLGDVWQDADYVWDLGGAYIGDGSYAPEVQVYSQGFDSSVDSWVNEAGAPGIAQSGSQLIFTKTTSGQSMMRDFPSDLGGKYVRMRLTRTSGTVANCQITAKKTDGTNLGGLASTLLTGASQEYLSGPLPAGTTRLTFAADWSLTTPGVLAIEYIDISDGNFGAALDTSPSALKLSCQPGLVRIPGPSGAAVDTTYGGLYSNVTTGLPMGNTPRTIPIFFRKTTAATAMQMLLVYGSAAAGAGLYLYHLTGNFVFEKWGTPVSIPDTGYVDGNWHCLEPVFTGTSVSLLIDGVVKFGPTAYTLSTVAGFPLAIGYDPGTAGRNFQGQIALPRMWARALSAAESLGLWTLGISQDAKSVAAQVATQAPKYLGVATSDPALANVGDRYYNSSTKKVRKLTISGWIDDGSSDGVMLAVNDILAIEAADLGGQVQAIQFVQNLASKNGFFQTLMANALKIMAGGSFRMGDRYNADGSIADASKPGSYWGPNGIPKVAGIVFEGAQGGGVQWGSAFLAGAASGSVGGSAVPALGALSPTDVVYSDNGALTTRVWRFDGSAWAAIGTAYGWGASGVCVLTPTRVALAGGGQIRVLDVSAGVFTQVGSTFTLANVSRVIAMNSTDIVAIVDDPLNANNDYLYYLRFNGSTISQIGSAFSLGTLGSRFSLSPLNATDLAILNPGQSLLRVLRFTEATGLFSQVGNSFTYSGTGYSAMAPLNGSDIVVIDSSSNLLSIYRWDGLNFTLVSSAGSTALTATVVVAMAPLDGASVAFVDATSRSLKKFGFLFSLSNPWRYPYVG